MAHTPGPWHAETAPCGTRVGLMGAGVHPVAMLGMKHALNPDDVRLIEQAPALLEAVRGLIFLRNAELAGKPMEDDSTRNAWHAARAVLAKLEG